VAIESGGAWCVASTRCGGAVYEEKIDESRIFFFEGKWRLRLQLGRKNVDNVVDEELDLVTAVVCDGVMTDIGGDKPP